MRSDVLLQKEGHQVQSVNKAIEIQTHKLTKRKLICVLTNKSDRKCMDI